MITIDKKKSTEIELGSIACYFLIIFYVASLNTLFFCGNLSSEIIIMSSSFFMCLSGVSITIFHDNERFIVNQERHLMKGHMLVAFILVKIISGSSSYKSASCH